MLFTHLSNFLIEPLKVMPHQDHVTKLPYSFMKE